MEFLEEIKEFLKIYFYPVSDPDCGWQARSVDRTKGRSTVRSTDVHSLVHVWQTHGPVDRSVDRTRELCSLYLGGRPGGRPNFPNGHILTVGGRLGRSTASLLGCQISLTASFLFGLYKPQLLGILAKVFKKKNSQFLLSLKQVFKSVFGL